MLLAEAASHQDKELPTFPRHPVGGRDGASQLGSPRCPRPADGPAVVAHSWALAGRAGSHRRHRGSPWTPLPAGPWVAGETTGLFIYHQGCDKECERGGEAHGVQCA